jgi:hypothetical protein
VTAWPSIWRRRTGPPEDAGGWGDLRHVVAPARARDAEAITHHFAVAPHTWEEAGRVLLGRGPIAPAF